MSTRTKLPVSRDASGVETNLMHAEWFAANGMTIQAIGFYRTAGTLAERAGDLRRALKAFDAVTRLEGMGSEAKLRIGEVQLRMGHPQVAAATLDAAANEALQSGRSDQALEAFRRAAEAGPTADRWARVLQWFDHFHRGDEGTSALESAAAKVFSASDDEALVVIARLLLARKPGHVPSLRQLIRVHLRRRELHRAVESISQLLRFRPGDADALEQMADAFAMLGRKDKAAEVATRLARSLIERGPSGAEEAKRLVMRGLTWRPGDSDLLLLRRRFPAPRRATPRRPPPRRRPPHQSAAAELPPLDLSDFVEAVPERPPVPTSEETHVMGDFEGEELTMMLEADMLEILGENSVVAKTMVRPPPRPQA